MNHEGKRQARGGGEGLWGKNRRLWTLLRRQRKNRPSWESFGCRGERKEKVEMLHGEDPSSDSLFQQKTVKHENSKGRVGIVRPRYVRGRAGATFFGGG